MKRLIILLLLTVPLVTVAKRKVERKEKGYEFTLVKEIEVCP